MPYQHNDCPQRLIDQSSFCLQSTWSQKGLEGSSFKINGGRQFRNVQTCTRTPNSDAFDTNQFYCLNGCTYLFPIVSVVYICCPIALVSCYGGKTNMCLLLVKRVIIIKFRLIKCKKWCNILHLLVLQCCSQQCKNVACEYIFYARFWVQSSLLRRPFHDSEAVTLKGRTCE